MWLQDHMLGPTCTVRISAKTTTTRVGLKGIVDVSQLIETVCCDRYVGMWDVCAPLVE